ncbi:MAG: histidinol-phosphate aminotransferase [Halanaerobiales bacterium]|nr:histidinol-phosphate aminotransferase [Halanaerobiales bacterium]
MLKPKPSKENDGWKRIVRKEINYIKPYVPGRPIAEVKAEYGLERVVKLASNENPLGVSDRVKEAIFQECEQINRYPDGASRSLKTDLCQKLNIGEDMLIFGNGSDGLLKVIAESFLEKNSNVVIPYPTFVEYTFVSYLMGSQLIRVWMNNYHQNLKAMAEAITSKTRLLFLTNPHNPTGTIFTKEEFELLLSNLPDDVILVVDEAYHEYVQDQRYPDVLEYIRSGYPIIVLRTFSKAYGLAGLRLGYAIARPEIIEVLSKARDPFNVNHLAERAGRAALRDTEFLKRTIENNERGKEYLYAELSKRGIYYVPTEANFILVKIDLDCMEVFKKLMEMGVIVRPGKPLGYRNHLRVSIGLPEENKFFINCIDKLMP